MRIDFRVKSVFGAEENKRYYTRLYIAEIATVKID